MGGKKGPEKNRKYEKDRRDRFNEQFMELHQLLPEFDSSSGKATKAEIITKTIQYLKETHTQTRKLENEFENEKIKVDELQKKVNGVLHIVKELIKLLHKSNIRFPSSLPVDDFKTFQDVFAKSEKDLTSISTKSSIDEVCSDPVVSKNNAESNEKSASIELPVNHGEKSSKTSESTPVTSAPTSSSFTDTNCGDHVANSEQPKILKLNSNALILPSGNLLAVNGVQNGIFNYCNSASPLLLNKQFTVPTLILMQNNFIPVNSVQHIAVSQRTQKLIMPKQTSNSTKTTFMNKKPIPAVRLYKSISAVKDGVRKAIAPRRRHSRRSKGILVKYPKRKPPTKNKKREIRSGKLPIPSKEISSDIKTTNKDDTFPIPAVQPSFPENSVDVDKSYSSTDSMLNTPEIPTSGQFIDFFESTSSRCIENPVPNNNSSGFDQNDELLKNEKSQIHGFVTNSFDRTFTNTDLNCDLIESHKEKETNKETEPECANQAAEKPASYVETSPTSESLLKYVPNIEKSFTPIDNRSSTSDNPVSEKQKSSEKEIVPLRSTPKDLNLSLIDDKKHFESSFDEFSNDLFTSLQVPSSGHNGDSISPTAAFLQTFPLVSSGTNVDLLPEPEDDSATTTTSTTILQIGNLESPSTILFSSKAVNRDIKVIESSDASTTFASFCTTGLELEGARKEKKEACKEVTQQSFNFNDASNFNNQLKPPCVKETVPQNMSFYPTTTSSTFSSYNIFTKYNDIPPPVTCSYYSSLCSQPFTATKTTDSIGDYSSWMPSVYTQENSYKDKTKPDKCGTIFRSTHEFGSQPGDTVAERPKTKKPKPNNTRPLVNWMTTPDLRNAPDTTQSTDVFALPKEDSTNFNSFLGSTTSNNANFNAYSSTDYFVESQNYSDPQLTSCKIPYSSSNPSNYTWSASKNTLPLPANTPNMIIPSTLPTLVGDLALGNTPSYNNYDLMSAKKCEPEKKKSCRNYCKSTATPNSSSFFSVTQLVDDKRLDKTTKKHPLEASACSFDEEREKFSYSSNHKDTDGTEYASKKNYPNRCKDTKIQQPVKCKKEFIKYQAPRCVSKENKKDTRHYSMQNCQVQNKEMNPLSSKNSNYSAESLIGSSNQNTCSSTGYFPYENSTNYVACSTNEYPKKRTDDTETLANVGYYSNTNYVYHNNLQGFNNYSFSNQCYNNYSSQIQPSGFQKKKDDTYNAKQDTTEWSLSSYSSLVQSDSLTNQKVDPKYKQSFANKYNQAQKNYINADMYNKYYQAGPTSSTSTQSKGNCAFNSTCSFNQPVGGQHFAETNCLAPSYDMKSTRNSGVLNSSTVHSATTLTNFNLSTIFPEINDKHCAPNRVNAVTNEKNDPKFNKGVVDEMNYNYFLQPSGDNNADHLYGSSTFPIHNFTDFTSRKTLK